MQDSINVITGLVISQHSSQGEMLKLSLKMCFTVSWGSVGEKGEIQIWKNDTKRNSIIFYKYNIGRLISFMTYE